MTISEQSGGEPTRKVGARNLSKTRKGDVFEGGEMDQAMADADGINLTVNASDDEFLEEDN